MFASFNKIFHPEEYLQYTKLTGNSPCEICEIYKEYEMKAEYGTIAERQDARLPESCFTCLRKTLWEMDCLTKLAWYENNDPKLK